MGVPAEYPACRCCGWPGGAGDKLAAFRGLAQLKRKANDPGIVDSNRDRGLIRGPVITDLDPGNTRHRFAVMQQHFRHRIAERVPVLQESSARHRPATSAEEQSADSPTFEVRLDQRQQAIPRTLRRQSLPATTAAASAAASSYYKDRERRVVSASVGLSGGMPKSDKSCRKRQIFQTLIGFRHCASDQKSHIPPAFDPE